MTDAKQVQQKVEWLEEQRRADQRRVNELAERVTDLTKQIDIEALVKRLDWLEGERRDDKKTITTLTERVADLREKNDSHLKRLSEMENALTRATSQLQRVANVESSFDSIRSEVVRQIEAAEQRRIEAEREAERLRQVEREGLNRAIAEAKKATEPIMRIEQEVAARREEERRLGRILSEQATQIENVIRTYQDFPTTLSKLEETTRNETRRNSNVQTEVSEARRRLEEYIGKLEVLEDIARRNESKTNDLVATETDRRMKQQAWMETQASLAAERERLFAELKRRSEELEALPEEIKQQLEKFAELQREAQKTVNGFQPILDRIERRINEASEIQRLQEEQFRQEWAAFQADDQKKWTTHMLLRDEQWRDHDREFQKSTERLTLLEDTAFDLNARMTRMQQTDQIRLQGIFNFIRELLSDYETTLTKAK